MEGMGLAMEYARRITEGKQRGGNVIEWIGADGKNREGNLRKDGKGERIG